MKNIDKYIKEPFEDNETLLKKIKELGSIKDIIVDKEKLLKIFIYNGDRHLLLLFIEQLNYEIIDKKIKNNYLFLLRSDWIITQMLNLEKLVKENGRNLYANEIADKMNYLTLIKDDVILKSIFTNSNLIKVIIQNPRNSQFNYWITSGSIYMNIPCIIQKQIASEFKKNGEVMLGSYIFNTAQEYQKRFAKLKYQENNYHYSKK